MLIQELTGYKTNPLYIKAKEIFGQDTRNIKLDIQLDQWDNIMKEYGFSKLGIGSSGIVFEKEGYPWVFKIFKHDKAYLSFYKYAKENQQYTCVPKIKGGLIMINDDTYAIRTEKLSPMTASQAKAVMGIVQRLVDLVADDLDVEDMEQDDQSLVKKFNSMYRVLYSIYHNQTFMNTIPDLSPSNIMMRGNTPVLVDPVAQ